MKRLDKLQETLSSIFGAHSDHENHEAMEDKEGNVYSYWSIANAKSHSYEFLFI